MSYSRTLIQLAFSTHDLATRYQCLQPPELDKQEQDQRTKAWHITIVKSYQNYKYTKHDYCITSKVDTLLYISDVLEAPFHPQTPEFQHLVLISCLFTVIGSFLSRSLVRGSRESWTSSLIIDSSLSHTSHVRDEPLTHVDESGRKKRGGGDQNKTKTSLEVSLIALMKTRVHLL